MIAESTDSASTASWPKLLYSARCAPVLTVAG